jgi:competence protein ComEC
VKHSAQARLLAGFLIAIFCLTFRDANLSSAHVFQQENIPQLEVHFIYVGQGDSTLIIAPDGSTALIDGGMRNDMALDYLRRLGIDSLDVVIATHPHFDHIGGLIDIIREIKVGGVWQPGSYMPDRTFAQFIDTIEEEDVPLHQVGTGDIIPLGDELTFEVVFGIPNAGSVNDTSLVTRLDYGDVSFLFTGDAEKIVEAYLADTAADQLPATVLQVGHHGSSTSTIEAFAEAVSPKVAVYSAGLANPSGHPHTVPLNNLEAVGAAVFGTNIHGNIVITTDGEAVQIYPTRNALPIVGELDREIELVAPEPGGFVNVLYDPNGASRDCNNFLTQPEAQLFFEAAGGPDLDWHGLDRDHDGIACESLPLIPPSVDLDCEQFATQAEAQAFFEDSGGEAVDLHSLDRDNDGLACESLP